MLNFACLSVLQKLYPINGWFYVGAGDGSGFSDLFYNRVPYLLAVEVDEGRYRELIQNIKAHPGWEAILALVSDIDGDATFYRTSNSRENGLLPPETLESVWKNIWLKETISIPAHTLGTILATQGKGRACNWITIDCLPAVPLLQGLGRALNGFDVIIARVALNEDISLKNAGASQSTLDSLLLTVHGFKLVGIQDETNANLATVIYARDWKAQCVSQTLELDEQRKNAHLFIEKSRVKTNKIYSVVDKCAGLFSVDKISPSTEDIKILFNNMSCVFDSPRQDLSVVSFFYNEINYHLLHVCGDYIPGKISKGNTFYETKLLEYLGEFCEKGSVVIDVGANIGNHSVYLSSVLDAHVYAIEPVYKNYVFLVANAAINNQKHNITPINIGFGDRFETINLQESYEGNCGSFRRLLDISGQNGFIESYAVTADWLLIDFYKINQVSLIKVDIEGMELEFIKGALNLIKRDHPVLAVECHSEEFYNKVLSILDPFGYVAVKVFEMGPTFVFVSDKNSIVYERYKNLLSSQIKKDVVYPSVN